MKSGRCGCRTAILFEGDVDEVQQTLDSPLSRRLVLLDGADLVDDNAYLDAKTSINLRGRDLTHAILYRADLRKADLRAARLNGANLRQADLQGAWFECVDKGEQAKVHGAAGRRSPLGPAPRRQSWAGSAPGRQSCAGPAPGCQFSRGTQLQGADLGSAALQGANLMGADLGGADLRLAQLQGAFLWQAWLQGADLREAQLQGANLVSVQLQGADLRKARFWRGMPPPADALEFVDFGGAEFGRCRLRKLRGCESSSRRPFPTTRYESGF